MSGLAAEMPTAKALVLDVACSRVELDPRASKSRAPLRPKAHRGPGIEAKADQLTLFADVFRLADPEVVFALAPPMTATYRGRGRGTSLPGGAACDLVWPVRGNTRYPERVRVRGAAEDGVLLEFGGQQVAVAVQPSLTGLFAGRRVLLTKSQDNRLEWIADWARFHQVHHGVDAVVLYDNNSSAYAPGDVARALAAVPGIAVVAVVPWPMLHGTRAYRLGWPRGDTHFGQATAIEHARWRLLAEAELVFQVDVDELVVPLGPPTVDDLFADPGVCWVEVLSQDIVATAEVDEAAVRARDCWHPLRGPSAGGRQKYVVAPRRCPAGAIWWMHWVAGVAARRADPGSLRIAHQLPLSTGWDDRQARSGMRAAAGQAGDAVLRQRLDEAFDGWDPRTTVWTPATSGDPDLLRAEAQRLAAAGEAGAALGVLQEAIRRDPWHPAQAELRRELLAKVGAVKEGRS